MKVFKITAVLILIYLSIIVLTYSMQTKLIFHPTKLDRDFRFRNDIPCEEVFLPTPDGETINGLFFPSRSDTVILYFHGNAGALDSWQYVYDSFRSLNYNFLIIDYRGYGKSTGKISEAGLYTDAQSAYDYLVAKGFEENKIIIYGRSIGTGVVVNLAANKNISALILEAPYTSLKKLATEKVPYLFPSLYIKYKFDNLSKINDIKSPLLIIHGTHDAVIPYAHGKKLYDSFNGKKNMVSIEGGGHNDLDGFEEFGEGVKRFLRE